MSYVFISHSSRDKHIVEPICHYLKQNKINYWTDREGIPVGLDYRGIIANAITSSECKTLLLILSYGSASSKEVDIEVSLARDYNKRILVYKIHGLDYDQRLGGIFYYIKYSQSIDATLDPVSKENLEKLVKAIEEEQVEGEDREILELKAFEVNEPYYVSDAKYYQQWGEAILKYADRFNCQNVEMYRQAKDKFTKSNIIDGTNYENYASLAVISLRLAKLERKLSLYEEGYEFYQKSINLNNNYKLLLGCINLVSDWALHDEKRRPELIIIAESTFKKAQEIEENNYNLYLDWAEFIYNTKIKYANAEMSDIFIDCCNMYKTAFQLNRQMDGILHKWNEVLDYWGNILGIENIGASWYFDARFQLKPDSKVQVRYFIFELAKLLNCYAQSLYIKSCQNESDSLNIEEVNVIIESSINKYESLIESSVLDQNRLWCNYGIAMSLKARINKSYIAFKKAIDFFDKSVNYESLYNSAILLLDWAQIAPLEKKDELLEEVISRLERAKKYRNDNPDILNLIGIAYKNISRGKSAEEEQRFLRKALDCFKQASDAKVQFVFKL